MEYIIETSEAAVIHISKLASKTFLSESSTIVYKYEGLGGEVGIDKIPSMIVRANSFKAALEFIAEDAGLYSNLDSFIYDLYCQGMFRTNQAARYGRQIRFFCADSNAEKLYIGR